VIDQIDTRPSADRAIVYAIQVQLASNAGRLRIPAPPARDPTDFTPLSMYFGDAM
jgi:hypothetical protein